MDDLYALDGGGAATAWQKRHQKRKAREAAKIQRRLAREEAMLDQKKRLKKWDAKWLERAVANKAAGLPPPSRKGRPHDNSLGPTWLVAIRRVSLSILGRQGLRIKAARITC